MKTNNSKYLIILVLLVGIFLRFFRLSELAMFVGDQGRDYLVARDILLNRKLILVGPQTSIPRIYLGPFFYYFLAFFLWLGKFNPVWPAYGIAFFGFLTIYLIFILGKNLFGNKVGLISAFFYAISPFAVLQSRISLHPSVYPVFVILFLLSLANFNLLGQILSFLVAIQLHLSAVLLLPIAIVSKKPKLLRLFWLASVGLISWKLLRHSPFTPLSYWWKIFEEIFSFGNWLGTILALLITFYGLFWLKEQKNSGAKILLTSFFVIVTGLTIKNSQAEHYFNLFLPVVILVFSAGLGGLSELNYGKLPVILICAFFLITNSYLLISSNYFIKIYGPGLAERIPVAKAIVSDSGGKNFLLARCGPLWDYPSTNNNYEYLIWWLGGKFQKKEKLKTNNLQTYIIYEPASSIEGSEVCENYFEIKKEGETIYKSENTIILKQRLK